MWKLFIRFWSWKHSSMVIIIGGVEFDFCNMTATDHMGQSYPIKFNGHDIVFKNTMGDWWRAGIDGVEEAYQDHLIEQILLK